MVGQKKIILAETPRVQVFASAKDQLKKARSASFWVDHFCLKISALRESIENFQSFLYVRVKIKFVYV